MKIPLINAYCRMTEGVGDISALSWRKRVCIQYLKWGIYAEDEDRVRFIELALEWRKVDKRVGGKRTLLERKMRKLLKQWRLHKAFAGQREAVRKVFQQFRREKRGVFSEEYRKERMWEQNKENMRRQLEAGRHPKSKEWIVYEPDGNVIRVWSLQKYAQERGLSRTALRMTARIPGKMYRGYRCELANELFEGL
jgi:hypothetical protein